ITEKLKKDMGDGPNDWSDLKALADAANEPDPVKRWQALDKVLDLNRFVSFMVMEVMTCHWDGYCLGRNNFRIYANRDSNKILFFPHGTDQMFQNPTSPIQPPAMQGKLAQAVIRTPQGRRLYRERFGTLFTNVFKIELLTSRVDTVTAQVGPFLATCGGCASRLLFSGFFVTVASIIGNIKATSFENETGARADLLFYFPFAPPFLSAELFWAGDERFVGDWLKDFKFVFALSA